MSTDFDPYHVWLGIPPDEQPPNRYRLLGIRPFEPNAEVIDGAADRQSAHLRTFQAGKHATLTQRLLNEVAAARVCLLNPQTKAAYDEQLRWALVASRAQPPAPRAATAQPESQLAQPANLPVAQSIAAARAQPSAPSTGNWDELSGPHEVKASKSSGTFRKRASAAQSNTKIVLLAVGGALLAAAVVAVVLINSNAEAVLTFNWPTADRAGATLAIDGQPVAIPASGSWEFHCQPGEHQIVAARPAFRFSRQVEVSAGDGQSVTPDWKPKAMLVLNWPLAERTGATLSDNGQRVAVSAREPFELAVEPGRHVLRIGRANAPPVETVVTVADDQRQTVALTLRHAGTLRINWPVADRQDGKLTIDGKEQPIASRELAFPLDPGRHSVRLYRDGFEPIEETVEVSDGPLKPVMPIWVRQKTSVAASGDTPVATAAAAQQTASIENSTPTAQKGVSSAADAVASQKLPVPAAADQKRIAAQIEQDFKPTSSPEDERRVAEQLFALADKSGTPADERYVALVKAIDWAAKAGDFDSAMQGIDRLADAYEIDPFEMKRQTIEDALKVGPSSPELAAAALGAAEQAADEAVDASRFDRALALCDAASKAAGKLASASGAKKEAVERIARRRGDIAAMQTASAAAVQAQSTLEKHPDNAEASAALGRWYCFFNRDWDRGLPLVAKGTEAALKSLADRELAVDLQLKPQLELADGWWDAGQKETGLARDSLRLHASEIYRLMLPNVQSDIKKTAIEKRLAEVRAIVEQHSMQVAGVPPGAVVLFTFDKNSFFQRDGKQYVRDMSGNGNDGRVNGTMSVQGRVGDALSFSGKVDYVECMNSKSLKFGEGITVGAWIKVRGWRERTYIVSKDDWNDGHAHGFVLRGDEQAAGGIDFTIGARDEWHQGRSEGKLDLDQWHHVVATNDGASTIVYVDGRPSGSSMAQGPIAPSNYNLRIGRGAFAPDRDFDGVIDEVAIFRRALSEKEVQSLYAMGQRGQSLGAIKRLAPPARQATVKTGAGGSEAETTSELRHAASVAFPHGQWVDVLKLVDTTKDAVKGSWSRSGSDVSCEPEVGALIKVPVAANGSYDLEVEFTRTDGDADVNTIITAGGQRCGVLLGINHGEASGLDRVDGKRPYDDGNPAFVRPGALVNGHRYRLLMNVRVPQPDHASIDVSLDGKPYFPHWEGDPASLSIYDGWQLTDTQQLALATWNTRVTFHSMRLKLIAGEATSLVSKNTPEFKP